MFIHTTEIKRRWFGWPMHEEIIEKLSRLKRGAISFETTKTVFPTYSRGALRYWLLHYHSAFEHLQRQETRADAYEVGLLDKLSLMLNQPVPSILDMLRSRKSSASGGLWVSA
jgi:hypothetical protein